MNVDVAILGGGLAGNLLARQLRRQSPDLSVALFERSTERAYKVGESTVEIATLYLTKRLGLSTYIYKEHLPKNGLRYFFDTPGRDAELPDMSEIGIHGLPPYPSFQLDRSRFEADLLEMNRADGVDVNVGVRVKDLTLDEASHRFTAVSEDGEQEVKARWVIDATGKDGMIAKARELRVPEKSHRIASAWGRATDVVDMDAINAPDFHARARYTSRVLSTNHFMYDGYWIWFIPLRNGITSIGIVQESKDWNVALHKEAGFKDFLRKHRAVGELAADARLLDLEAFTQLAFRTKRFFSTERWAVVGNAAAFPDPFYSPGSDFIAVENDIVCDLIARSFAGEAIEERVELYDRYMHFRFDSTLVIYDGLYPTFGSYELYRAKVFFDTGSYYNLLFDSYARDEHLDARWLRSSLRRKDSVMSVMGGFADLFRSVAGQMREQGTYHRYNTGHHSLEGRDAFGVMEAVGAPRSRREIHARSEEIFERTRAMLRDCVGDDSTFAALRSGAERTFDAWSALG
ncbi:MAG: tryptophan 7-halogenase [Myxococcota bacterium]